MDYKKINVPLINKADIKRKADLFRKRFWGDTIPVDMEDIIELKLKIDIIPTKRLQALFGIDALITSKWHSIYVDYGRYSDSRYQNRLRFSLAHEIGHFVLHKDIYNSMGIKDLKDFYTFFKNIPQRQYEYFEFQANKFANYLLVPREQLIIKRDKEMRKLDKIKTSNVFNSYLAIPIAKTFAVSEQVIEIALNEIADNR